jgi:hypothetical protein
MLLLGGAESLTESRWYFEVTRTLSMISSCF